ncbi:Uncharacterised protein [Legionella wadsworthii]|uniref:Uncharacterized protein n=1 Tax=Legionella wadsworthii TaxID=28088 RepID=A0A378LU46_9GAMM|nr:hypothetical protein [Legionella wadsworthii]STY31036.1 Uncharacterised protein [Legionella wadsworthii]
MLRSAEKRFNFLKEDGKLKKDEVSKKGTVPGIEEKKEIFKILKHLFIENLPRHFYIYFAFLFQKDNSCILVISFKANKNKKMELAYEYHRTY